MTGSLSLGELQRWMRWVLTHPAGVERALGPARFAALPVRFQAPCEDLSCLMDPGAPGSPSALARLGVHADGYFSRLLSALEADFPGLAELLGPEAFRALVGQHLLAHPSISPSLGDLGAALPATLAAAPVGAERPWAVDLARLERAVVEVWLTDAVEPRPLLADPEVDWAEVRLEIAPTLQLLELEWTADLWRALRQPPRPGRRTLAVWRQAASVEVTPLAPAAWSALNALRAGRPLAEACQVAEHQGCTADQLMRDVASWRDRGWVVGQFDQELTRLQSQVKDPMPQLASQPKYFDVPTNSSLKP